MNTLDAQAMEHSTLGIISFYDSFCDASVPEEYGGEPDARQLRIRNFLKFILVGVENQEICMSGDIESVRQYIKLVDQGQEYRWEWPVGEEKPQYKKVGATACPEVLRLEMFSLEQVRIDPVPLLQWLRGRRDRAAFLAEGREMRPRSLASDIEQAVSSENVPLGEGSETHIPRHLWGEKPPQQVRDDMRAAGYPDDAIAYALYNWRGLQNKTEIGRLLRGGDMVDASYYKYACKQLKSVRQWGTDPQGS